MKKTTPQPIAGKGKKLVCLAYDKKMSLPPARATNGMAISEVQKMISNEDAFREMVSREFARYDKNGDGFLEFSELKHFIDVMCTLTDQSGSVTQRELQERFNKYSSKKKKGFIKFQEFHILLKELLFITSDAVHSNTKKRARQLVSHLAADTIATSDPNFTFQCTSTADTASNSLRDAETERKQSLIDLLKSQSGSCDWRNLETLQELFSVGSGLTYDEFKQLFISDNGRKEGPFTGMEDGKEVFSLLDMDRSGKIGWDEFSSFLINSEQSQAACGTNSCTIQGETQPYRLVTGLSCGPKHVHHKSFIKLIVIDYLCDRYFTAGNDGTVKSWNSRTSCYETTVFDCVGGVSVMLLPSPGTLLITGDDRSLHLFASNPQGTVPLRQFMGGAYLHGGIQKKEVFRGEDPFDQNIDAEGRVKQGSVDMSHRVGRLMLVQKREYHEYCTLEGLTSNISACCKLSNQLITSPSQQGHQQTKDELNYVAVGTDVGQLLVYGLILSEPVIHPSLIIKPHDQCITAISSTLEKRSLITSSLDRTIRVTNIDKCSVTSVINLGSASGGGILGFSYCASLQMAAAAAGSSKVYIANHMTGYSFVLSDHKEMITDILWIDHQKYIHLATLAEGKTLKIWETTNFRCIQTFTDKQRRWPQDTLRGMAYDTIQQRLLVGAGRKIICFKYFPEGNSIKQTRASLGEVASKQPLNANSITLSEVCQVLYSSKKEHVIAADYKSIIVWELLAGERISSFRITNEGDELLTSLALHSKNRLVVVSTHSDVKDQTQLVLWDYIVGLRVKQLSMGPHCNYNISITSSLSYGWVVAGGEPNLLVWREYQRDSSPVISFFQEFLSASHGIVQALTYLKEMNKLFLSTSIQFLVLFSVTEERISVCNVLNLRTLRMPMYSPQLREFVSGVDESGVRKVGWTAIEAAVKLSRLGLLAGSASTNTQSGVLLWSHRETNLVYSSHNGPTISIWRSLSDETPYLDLLAVYAASQEPLGYVTAMCSMDCGTKILSGDSGGHLTIAQISNVVDAAASSTTILPPIKREELWQSNIANRRLVSLITSFVAFKSRQPVVSVEVVVCSVSLLCAASKCGEISLFRATGVLLTTLTGDSPQPWPLKVSGDRVLINLSTNKVFTKICTNNHSLHSYQRSRNSRHRSTRSVYFGEALRNMSPTMRRRRLLLNNKPLLDKRRSRDLTERSNNKSSTSRFWSDHAAKVFSSRNPPTLSEKECIPRTLPSIQHPTVPVWEDTTSKPSVFYSTEFVP